MNLLETIALNLRSASSIAVLTGAGVSTASGIPDFRSSEGLWSEDQTREYYMSSHYFSYNPEDFWKKYKAIFRIKLLKNYHPNKVHHFLQELESDERDVSIITQNVDGLHEKAGSSQIVEYHGTLNHASCPKCGKKFSLDYVMNQPVPSCSHCHCVLKPDVVLFGDLITAHEEAEKMITQADFLLVLGTSLLVTPFSLLAEQACRHPALSTAIINNEPTGKDHLFDYVVHQDLSAAVDTLRELVS
ncbi:NAD-dependent protein deacylase [Halobacillus salinarum]|uniref:protein acetyllysine N-acetyltransferase n=1 Tax=Halobacillus salinarum TaxID=2932257 RepID=A0ABY4EGJ3_9BACI|nr:NAD-dependent protein deacylase [Halobacillus salinarum]UOQ43261.1 NAD-dependent protein deacylase [Halobacillus salinarum]